MKRVLLGLVLAGAVVLGGCSACNTCVNEEPCNKCVMDSQTLCSDCDEYMLPVPNITEL